MASALRLLPRNIWSPTLTNEMRLYGYHMQFLINNSNFSKSISKSMSRITTSSEGHDGSSRKMKGSSNKFKETNVEVDEIVESPTCEELFKGQDCNFPCATRTEMKGPEPAYENITTGYKLFTTKEPFHMKYNNGVLPELNVAYETWGELNEKRNNAVLVHAGLSASSHAKSHPDNPRPGWWEKFVGPGCAVDTTKFFVICSNNLGGCYGTSGPSSINPLTGKQYATTFPVISVEDMVNAQGRLLDHLGIDRIHASVGSSLGGMLSLMLAATAPERVGRVISISSCGHSHPSSIGVRYLQRKCIMSDPHWNKGFYYDGPFPKTGMKLARELATMTYRSGPEWDERFGRNFICCDDPKSLCPTFTIESYLEHQGESFSTMYDPNSLLYISKAMDLFDLAEDYSSLEEGLARIKCPVMVIGVQTDILFPIWQQRELSLSLQKSGNDTVTYYELNSIYGHDTFLLDLNGVGAGVKGFLETRQSHSGWLTKHKSPMKERKHFFHTYRAKTARQQTHRAAWWDPVHSDPRSIEMQARRIADKDSK